MLTTNELCTALDVSRSWGNKYLREFGHTNFANHGGKIICYNPADVVTYINRNAQFSRQSQVLDLADYVAPEAIAAAVEQIDCCLDPMEQATLWAAFVHAHIPAGYHLIPPSGRSGRGERGWWQVPPDEGGRVQNLDDLRSMNQLRQAGLAAVSAEIVYRDNYERGRIKVQLHGRVWFMDDPMVAEEPREQILVSRAPKPNSLSLE